MVKMIDGYAEVVVPNGVIYSVYDSVRIAPPEGERNFLVRKDMVMTADMLDLFYADTQRYVKEGLDDWDGTYFVVAFECENTAATFCISDEDIEGMTIDEIGELIFDNMMDIIREGD